MKELVAGFSKQLKKAIEIGKAARLNKHNKPIHNVLIAGLGGSGIGGNIVRELVANEANVPISICKGYFIPEFVNENTLFIASSYSGNTEETLQALEQAIAKKAKIVCITSGGKIKDIAEKNNFDHIVVPGGFPPRSCLGYSLTQLFFILKFFGIIHSDIESQLNAAIELIDKEERSITELADKTAGQLENKLPVIYTTSNNEGVAIRFRQQLNENAKILCWHHVIPEMNHNELVGWCDKREGFAVVLFRDTDEYSRNNIRIDINKQVITKHTSEWIELFSKGKTKLEKAIYFIHLGDWISCYLADRRGCDANEINVINHLKSELSKS
ncbi:MAG: bifunctional phosphoglucose/phosphomannose isomerase [Bacteroidia bacterium]|nr:bifunctional phosphoglucose/phosphomannose isomerase [Bacteroidia bacterium]